jgi:hypothetical protein
MNSADRSHVEALAEHIARAGWIKFGEMNKFLESRDISTTTGDEELRGEHVGQPHVSPGTTLLGPTSEEYVVIVEALFKSYPVMPMIGDMADFAGDEPWWVTWTGSRAAYLDAQPNSSGRATLADGSSSAPAEAGGCRPFRGSPLKNAMTVWNFLQ